MRFRAAHKVDTNVNSAGDGDRILVVGKQYLVRRDIGHAQPAILLDLRTNRHQNREAYISFVGEDKRLDVWVREGDMGAETTHASEGGPSDGPGTTLFSSKRKCEDEASPICHAPPSEDTTTRWRHENAAPSVSNPSTPEREHAAMTRMRNFEDVRFGEYLIKTWYYSPYPFPLEEAAITQATVPSSQSISKGNLSPNRKLFSAHRAFTVNGTKDKPKSMSAPRTSDTLAAGMGKGLEAAGGRLWPPGRKVYQRGGYTIWEIDGAQASLYCQNLSLFGKLFIDHKSVFFHVDNFLFYVLCDAATSRRDQVMAFFSKQEKLSYDDYNLACIVTFPPFQNQGFGKLLIELSYYLTRHPSTKPASDSPGTPERPLSDLGLKGYTAFWVTVILRFCRQLLADAVPVQATPKKPLANLEGRKLRNKSDYEHRVVKEVETIGGIGDRKST
ncbi:MAG: hypothetical protein TREMPRED_005393, partial [Tremellales sp. Tagirdzhanova-0007]